MSFGLLITTFLGKSGTMFFSILQKRIWDRLPEAAGPERLATLLEELKAEDGRFHVEGGSWTNDISWVRVTASC